MSLGGTVNYFLLQLEAEGCHMSQEEEEEGVEGLSAQGGNTLRPHCSTPLFTVSNEIQADFIHAPKVQLKAECVDGA